MKCPECEREMDYVDNPREVALFRIPFTDIEIRALNFSAKEWICIECYTERHDEPYRAAFDAGAEVGYERAQKDYRFGG